MCILFQINNDNYRFVVMHKFLEIAHCEHCGSYDALIHLQGRFVFKLFEIYLKHLFQGDAKYFYILPLLSYHCNNDEIEFKHMSLAHKKYNSVTNFDGFVLKGSLNFLKLSHIYIPY